MIPSPPPHGLREHAYLAARRRSVDPALRPVDRRQALAEVQQLRRGGVHPYRAAELDDQLLAAAIDRAEATTGERS